MFTCSRLSRLSYSAAGNYLQQIICPWKVLDSIYNYYIQSFGSTLGEGNLPLRPLIQACSTEHSPTAYLGYPCTIGPDSEVRHDAWTCGLALNSQDWVIGAFVKLKNAISMNRVQILRKRSSESMCPLCCAHFMRLTMSGQSCSLGRENRHTSGSLRIRCLQNLLQLCAEPGHHCRRMHPHLPCRLCPGFYCFPGKFSEYNN